MARRTEDIGKKEQHKKNPKAANPYSRLTGQQETNYSSVQHHFISGQWSVLANGIIKTGKNRYLSGFILDKLVC